ncbi:MAG: GNAT family N-acetyltransferase, partial [Chloroflexota bacterium]|nr:GNAT family N-acetyltransferase [Chloroflexota bacterium]
QELPPHWSHNNPIDILGDAGPDRYAAAARLAMQNPDSDGLLVILTPQAMADPTATAEQLQALAKASSKPLLASWMGGAHVAEGEAILNRANIPTFRYPDTAARAFHSTWRYSYNLRGLYETPILSAASDQVSAQRSAAEQHMRQARTAGRTLLNEVESKQLLAAYSIPSVETQAAASEDEAARIAHAIGYPVAVKLLSETITHKSDLGGVRLHLAGSDAVRRAYREIQAAVTKRAGAEHFLGVTVQPMAGDRADGIADGYELILGSSPDPQLGPVLLVGAGGQPVEVLRDHALGLPPLTTTLARRMIERTRIFSALQGLRGRPPVDLAALEQLMVRFSQLVVEQPWIREIEINPLLVGAQQLLALDARVVLYGPEVTEEALPRPAIRPYPIQYIRPYTLRSGTEVLIRPIRPEDEPLIVTFHSTLSKQSVYLRYFYPMSLEQRIAHDRLTRICFIDYDREMVLVAEHADTSGQRAIIGVGRLTKIRGANHAEFATVVSDAYQGQGIGSELLRRLIAIGRDERIERVVADVLPDNRDMQRVFKQLGFRFRRALGEPIRVDLDL